MRVQCTLGDLALFYAQRKQQHSRTMASRPVVKCNKWQERKKMVDKHEKMKKFTSVLIRMNFILYDKHRECYRFEVWVPNRDENQYNYLVK